MAKSVIIQTQENAAKIIVDGNEISDVLSLRSMKIAVELS